MLLVSAVSSLNNLQQIGAIRASAGRSEITSYCGDSSQSRRSCGPQLLLDSFSRALQLPTAEEMAHGGSRSAAKDKMSGKQKLCVSFTTLTNSNTTEQRQGLILTRSGPDQQTPDLLEEIRTDRLIYIIIFPMHM